MFRKAKQKGQDFNPANMENAIIDAMWIHDEFKMQFEGYNLDQAVFDLKCRGCPDLMF
jgi:hypothetical protein